MKEKSWVCVWGVLFTLATFVSGLFSWFTPLPLFYIGRRYSIRLALLGYLAVLVLLGILYALLAYALVEKILQRSFLKGFRFLKEALNDHGSFMLFHSKK